jgi:hypothetical protein
VGWERDFTDGATADGLGEGQTSLRYVVTGGYTAAQIIADPTSIRNDDQESLPAYGSVHPEDSRMRLDRYQVSTEGRVATVVGLYSIGGSGRLPAPTPPQVAGDARFDNDSERFSFLLPFSKFTVEKIPDPDNPAPATVDVEVWRPGVREVEQEGQVLSIRVIIPPSMFVQAIAAVDAQHGKLHIFYGRHWEFRRSPIRYRPASDDYETTYTWFRDPGFDLPNGYNDLSTQTYPTIWPQRITFNGQTMTRPPFHVFVDDPNNNNTDLSVPQEYVAVLAKTIDATGWQTLPGVPNL